MPKSSQKKVKDLIVQDYRSVFMFMDCRFKFFFPGLPFLILFHHPDDNESVKRYSDIVARDLLEVRPKICCFFEDLALNNFTLTALYCADKFSNEQLIFGLLEDKQNINFLIADGIKFAHPLHHLGKSKEDLPLIAIDSFRYKNCQVVLN